jgi:hypothetical protein
MRNLIWRLTASATAMIIFPMLGLAQFGSIAGTVRHNSGAVLLGVMVEASSPALIEKSRTAVSDGTGQYRIEQLRPGTYPVSFTLSGFNTFRQDNVDISADFTAPVNAALNGSHASNFGANYTITTATPNTRGLSIASPEALFSRCFRRTLRGATGSTRWTPE